MIRTLRARPDRTAQDIIVPNNITTTFRELQALGLATPYYGSVLSYLHSTHYLHTSQPFGLIYLDYCCRLEAGGSQAEKSPVSDICTLFELHFIDPSGYPCMLLCFQQEERVC